MDLIFVLLLVVITSLGAYQGLRRIRPAKALSMSAALRAFFEWVGAFALFSAANLALGVLIILAIRGFTPGFIPLYALQNLLLLILSAAQAFVFQQCWKDPR